MTVTLDWTIAVGLAVWTAAAFWLGRAIGRDRSRDLTGPPVFMPEARPVASPAPAVMPETAAPGLRPDQIEAVLAELARGNKIAAIKLLRDATGIGLAEAKQVVEAMEAEIPAKPA